MYSARVLFWATHTRRGCSGVSYEARPHHQELMSAAVRGCSLCHCVCGETGAWASGLMLTFLLHRCPLFLVRWPFATLEGGGTDTHTEELWIQSLPNEQGAQPNLCAQFIIIITSFQPVPMHIWLFVSSAFQTVKKCTNGLWHQL